VAYLTEALNQYGAEWITGADVKEITNQGVVLFSEGAGESGW